MQITEEGKTGTNCPNDKFLGIFNFLADFIIKLLNFVPETDCDLSIESQISGGEDAPHAALSQVVAKFVAPISQEVPLL